MNTQPALGTLIAVLRDRGQAQYGAEPVSQLAHALQCATLAEQHQRSAALISACLLHDIGHLLHSLGDDIAERGVDDRHEYRAIPALRTLFTAAVTEPIRLHVEAKRYLCAVDQTYWQTLSPASQLSLELQGGIFTPSAATAFIQQPYAADAVDLRRWDDLAKDSKGKTPSLEHFVPYLGQCLTSSAVNVQIPG